MDWYSSLQSSLQKSLGLSADTQHRILLTILVVLIFVTIRIIIRKICDSRIKDATKRYLAHKTVSYIIGFLAVVVLITVWVGGQTGIAAYLGLLSAGLAIALQAPLTNLAGWAFIAVRKPFVVGDRIQVEDSTGGDVIDVRLFSFSVIEIGNWVQADQSTGRIVHIPNSEVFKSKLANYTQGFNFIWNEIPVTVTFESDWRKTKDVLTEIAQKHTAIKSESAARQVQRAARKYLILFDHLTPIVWTSVVDIGVTLTIRYLSEPRKRRSSEEKIWEEILTTFAEENNMDFAYPTTRYYDNRLEGKPALRTAPKE